MPAASAAGPFGGGGFFDLGVGRSPNGSPAAGALASVPGGAASVIGRPRREGPGAGGLGGGGSRFGFSGGGGGSAHLGFAGLSGGADDGEVDSFFGAGAMAASLPMLGIFGPSRGGTGGAPDNLSGPLSGPLDESRLLQGLNGSDHGLGALSAAGTMPTSSFGGAGGGAFGGQGGVGGARGSSRGKLFERGRSAAGDDDGGFGGDGFGFGSLGASPRSAIPFDSEQVALAKEGPRPKSTSSLRSTISGGHLSLCCRQTESGGGGSFFCWSEDLGGLKLVPRRFQPPFVSSERPCLTTRIDGWGPMGVTAAPPTPRRFDADFPPSPPHSETPNGSRRPL